MPITLFDEGKASYQGLIEPHESGFHYLARSARSPFIEVRRLTESWFAMYPREGQDELFRRLHSGDAVNEAGAFSELYCHAIIVAHGYTASLHPIIDVNRSSRLDFVVSRKNQPLFYLEVTNAMPSDAERKDQSRDIQVDAVINSMDIPDFYVNKHIKKRGRVSVPGKAFKRFINNEIRKLRLGETTADYWQRFAFSNGDWIIEISLLPRTVPQGEKRSQNLGVSSYPAEWINSSNGLRNSLASKATKYGDLDLPFVVAVNCADIFFDDNDIVTALLGDEEVIVPSNGGQTRFRRSKDGIWCREFDRHFARVSAVLVFKQLVPSTIGSVEPVLWHHPRSARPFDTSWWQGPQNRFTDELGTVSMIPGLPFPDILDTRAVSQLIADERFSSR